MRYSENAPRWAEKILTKWGAKFRSELPEGIEPVDLKTELGCGYYGCVWTTDVPGWVLKLTMDETEAKFVNHAIKSAQPDGITEYGGVYALRGETVQHDRGKKQVYVLWREEVDEVGLDVYQGWEPDDVSEAYEILRMFKGFAQGLRRFSLDVDKKTLSRLFEKGRWDKPPARDLGWRAAENRRVPYQWRGEFGDAVFIAAIFSACWHFTDYMTSNPVLWRVGKAMQHYMKQGIVLADVHYNNVGLIEVREDGIRDEDAWVITDPGHAVFMGKRWNRDKKIPELYVRKARKKKGVVRTRRSLKARA